MDQTGAGSLRFTDFELVNRVNISIETFKLEQIDINSENISN